MNRSCLCCFAELEGLDQVDFHDECQPTMVDGSYIYRSADLQSGYIPTLEALAMRLARVALILTRSSTLVRSSDGELQFAMAKDSSVESLSDFVGSLEGCEFDGSVEMIADVVDDFSSISRLDLVNLFEQVIFGWVVGCDSLSLGSFAFSRPNAGVCSLAAAFDFVPQLGSSGEFALTVNGKRKGIVRRDFEAAMRYMGLKDRIIRITIEKMINSKERWLEIIERAPLSEEQRSQFASIISCRIAALA